METMKHKSCRALYDYWDHLRDGERAPLRSAIEPSAISEHLRDTFILETSQPAYPFRLAGTRLCALLGNELRGASFLDLWSPEDRLQIRSVLSGIADEGVGAVLGVTAKGRPDHEITLELLLLPLVLSAANDLSGPNFDRVLGALMPMQLPYWLGLEPLHGLEITSARQLRHNDLAATSAVPSTPDIPSLVATTTPPAMRRHGRFVVVEGGKS